MLRENRVAAESDMAEMQARRERAQGRKDERKGQLQFNGAEEKGREGKGRGPKRSNTEATQKQHGQTKVNFVQGEAATLTDDDSTDSTGDLNREGDFGVRGTEDGRI